MRDDIHGRQAPRHLAGLLGRLYGRTPFGEARYRLVWAPARLERSGGLWTDWAPALRAAERIDGRAIRRRLEMRWAPKYPGEECWLIERWQPARAYGTPERWYRPLEEGGTVLVTPQGAIAALGDYPTRGDYEDIGARMHWYPTEHHLTMAIGAFEHALAQASTGRPGVRHAEQRAAEREAARDRAFDQAAEALFDDAMPAFHGAPMAGAGPKRRGSLVERAERIGIREHPY